MHQIDWDPTRSAQKHWGKGERRHAASRVRQVLLADTGQQLGSAVPEGDRDVSEGARVRSCDEL